MLIYNNIKSETYIVPSIKLNSDEEIYLSEELMIFNGEYSSLKLDNIKLGDYEIIKFIVTNEEDIKNETSKEIITKKPSVIVKNKKGWKTIDLLFNFEEIISNKLYITIIAYNIKGEKGIIKIPYTVVYNSLSSIGADFEIIDCHLRSDSKTNVILKDKKSGSIITILLV